MAKYPDWGTLGAHEEAVASGRMSGQALRLVPSLAALSVPGRRDAALAELLATQSETVLHVNQFGAVGVGDETAQLQAAFDAAPFGATVAFDAIAYTFTHLVIDASLTLQGAGWSSAVDALAAFGDAHYIPGSFLNGTILQCTATSGTGIVMRSSTDVGSQFAMRDLVVLGPGSGTSIGLALGTATAPVVGAHWFNVAVMNFATGALFTFVEDCQFDSFRIRGCTTGLALITNSNQNGFDLLDIQRCTDALTLDVTCLGNSFGQPIFQSNTGTVVTLNGIANVFRSPWFENAGCVRALDVVSGLSNALYDPFLALAADTVRVQAGAGATILWNVSGAGTIANAGPRTFFCGVPSAFTNTGFDTQVLDMEGGNLGSLNLAQILTPPVGGLLVSPGPIFCGTSLGLSDGGSGFADLQILVATKKLRVMDATYTTVLMSLDEATGNMRLLGNLGVGNSAAGTSLGSVTKKIEVFDADGVSLGFVPVYDAIT